MEKSNWKISFMAKTLGSYSNEQESNLMHKRLSNVSLTSHKSPRTSARKNLHLIPFFFAFSLAIFIIVG